MIEIATISTVGRTAWYGVEQSKDVIDSVKEQIEDNEPTAIYNLWWHREVYPSYNNTNTTSFSFYINNKAHRFNGPSHVSEYYGYIDNDGTYYMGAEGEWSINGKEVDEEEYFAFLDQNEMNINDLSEEDKFLIALEFING